MKAHLLNLVKENDTNQILRLKTAKSIRSMNSKDFEEKEVNKIVKKQEETPYREKNDYDMYLKIIDQERR